MYDHTKKVCLEESISVGFSSLNLTEALAAYVLSSGGGGLMHQDRGGGEVGE